MGPLSQPFPACAIFPIGRRHNGPFVGSFSVLACSPLSLGFFLDGFGSRFLMG